MKKEFKIILLITLLLAFLGLGLILVRQSMLDESVSQGAVVDYSLEAGDLKTVSEVANYIATKYRLDGAIKLQAKTIEEMTRTEVLNLADLVYLTAYLLEGIGLEPGIIRYDYGNQTNLLVLVREGDLPLYLYFAKNNVFLGEAGWSFRDLMRTEEKRLGIQIERYAYFPANTLDFSEVVAPFQWQYLD